MSQFHGNVLNVDKEKIDILFLLKKEEEIKKASKINFKKRIRFLTPLDYIFFEHLIFLGKNNKKIKMQLEKGQLTNLEEHSILKNFEVTTPEAKSKYNFDINKDQYDKKYLKKEISEKIYREVIPKDKINTEFQNVHMTNTLNFLKSNNINGIEVTKVLGELITNIYSHSKESDYLVVYIQIKDLEIQNKDKNLVEIILFNYGELSKTIPENISNVIEGKYPNFLSEKPSDFNMINYCHSLSFVRHITSRETKDSSDSGVGLSNFLENLKLLEKEDENQSMGYTVSGKSLLYFNDIKEDSSYIYVNNKSLISKENFSYIKYPFKGTAYLYEIIL